MAAETVTPERDTDLHAIADRAADFATDLWLATVDALTMRDALDPATVPARRLVFATECARDAWRANAAALGIR